MVICICRNVSERDIAHAVAGGCSSFKALQEKLDVGTCCGTCECAAREVLAEHHRDARCEVAA
jgi:bacterioferritin-associated ferredoxin